MTAIARMSSATTTVSMKARSRSESRGPASARTPSAKAVSVASTIPQPCAEKRQHEAPSLPKLAEVELAPRLEPDDEEEERHQPAVHPLAKRKRNARAAEVDRQRRLPQLLVRGRVDVHPDERRNRRPQQDRRAGRLGTQKLPQRRPQAARPRRPAREAQRPRRPVQTVVGRVRRIALQKARTSSHAALQRRQTSAQMRQ